MAKCQFDALRGDLSDFRRLNFLSFTRPNPRWDWIERGPIDFVVVAVGNPDYTILSLELRHHQTEFARKLLGSIRGNI
jgi:hypothetical protein